MIYSLKHWLDRNMDMLFLAVWAAIAVGVLVIALEGR